MLEWGQVPDLWAEHAIRMLSVPEPSPEARHESLQRIRAGRSRESGSLEGLVGVWDETRLWSACWLHDLGQLTAAFGDPWLAVSQDPASSQQRDVVERTIGALSQWCDAKSPRLVQGMLSPEARMLWGAGLCEQGWAREGGLDYLGRVISMEEGVPRPDRRVLPRGHLVEATRLSDSALENLVARTQQDSLDCRYLEGRRSVSEMVAAFRSATLTKDSLWLVLYDAGEPIGCLFFGLHDSVTAEWIYLGLIPERRGQGVGLYLAQSGLQIAHRLKVSSVLVAVDSLNHLAIQLYQRLGFSLWDRRSVFLKWGLKASESWETAS